MNIVHTMASESCTKILKRRFYSPDLKCQVVAQCGQPGASIAAVALGHGINANIVHRWIREHGQGTLAATSPAFIPVTLNEVPRQAAAPVPPPDIRIEVQRTNATVVVHWPLQDAGVCAQWLREWLQ
ncbi:MAG: transposase [Rhodoferax sp.]